MIKLLIQQFKVCQIVEGEDRTSITSSGDNLGQLFKAWRHCNEFVMKEPCRTCPQVWRLLMWTTKKLSLKNPFRYDDEFLFIRFLLKLYNYFIYEWNSQKKKVNEELNWWNYVVKGFEIRNDKKINNKYVCMKAIYIVDSVLVTKKKHSCVTFCYKLKKKLRQKKGINI